MLSKSSLSVSDWIQICSIITTTATSIIALKISNASLKQTERITRDASKPIINISLEYFQDTHNRKYYLCIKNVGKSYAVIKSIKYYPDNAFEKGGDFIEMICPFSLNPSQKVTSLCTLNDYKQFLVFDIEYVWDNECFKESFLIQPVLAFSSRESIPNKLTIETAIIHAAQQITKSKF